MNRRHNFYLKLFDYFRESKIKTTLVLIAKKFQNFFAIQKLPKMPFVYHLLNRSDTSLRGPDHDLRADQLR